MNTARTLTILDILRGNFQNGQEGKAMQALQIFVKEKASEVVEEKLKDRTETYAEKAVEREVKHLTTKGELYQEMGHLTEKIDLRMDKLDARMDRLEEKMDMRMDRLDMRMDKLDGKFQTMLYWIIGIFVSMMLAIVLAVAAYLFK